MEDKVREALKAGDAKAIDGMGSRARATLFKMISDAEEDLLFRRMAADTAIELYEDSIRHHDRLICLLLQDRVADAASLKNVQVSDIVSNVLCVVKNPRENAILRSIAVDVLVYTQRDKASDSTFTVIMGLKSLLSNEGVIPVVRVKIAEELPKLLRICDDKKKEEIKSALERASKSESSSVAFAAEDAIDAIKAIEQKEAEEKSSEECVDDQNPTLRLPRK